MITIRDAISLVWEGLNVSTDDTSLYDEYIYNSLKNVRTELIRQEVEKVRLLSKGQVIPNFRLTSVDISECVHFTSGTRILKSVDNLPLPIETEFGGPLIFSVYTNTGTIIIKTTYRDWVDGLNRTHRLRVPKYFLRDIGGGTKMFVVGYDEMTDELCVNPEGIWDSPEEVAILNNTDDCLFIPDLEFNAPGFLLNRIIETTKNSIRSKFLVPDDESNNSREDVQINQKP